MTISPADAICQFIPPFMRFLREGLVDLNMTPARFQILEAIKFGGAQTMVELAKQLSVTKRNVTSLVDGLEKDGLATRQPHPTDRRATLVQLTDEGERLFFKAAELQRQHLKDLFTSLEAEQQAEMSAALVQLTQALAARKKNPEGNKAPA